MGISLVDQEPVALPKSRSQNMSVEGGAYDSMNQGTGDSKKAKPQKTVCIITEFLEQGSLADILYGPTKLPAEIWTYELVLTCALQAARGMLYLHSHSPPICHRDLKSSNLVVDDHWVVKVTDFGMSRIVPENVQNREKGLEPNAGIATSHPLGPRKFSLGASPKFIMNWATGNSPAAQTSSIARGKTVARNVAADSEAEDKETSDWDGEGGERHSTNTMDSHDQGHAPLSDYTNNSATNSLYRKSHKHSAGSRLSQFNPEMTSNLGTTAWCAPEVLVAGMKTRYTVKVDVYSFGLVLWELWEKKRPFEELTSRFDIMDAVRAGKRPEISANCPPSFRSLIQRCWQHEPSRRPMFKYIVRYLKDELARVKRQKGGGAVYNRDSEMPGLCLYGKYLIFSISL
jgi:serine/threonine protein kinase